MGVIIMKRFKGFVRRLVFTSAVLFGIGEADEVSANTETATDAVDVFTQEGAHTWHVLAPTTQTYTFPFGDADVEVTFPTEGEQYSVTLVQQSMNQYTVAVKVDGVQVTSLNTAMEIQINSKDVHVYMKTSRGNQSVKNYYDVARGKVVIKLTRTDGVLQLSNELVTFADIHKDKNKQAIESLASRYIVQGSKDTYQPNDGATYEYLEQALTAALGDGYHGKSKKKGNLVDKTLVAEELISILHAYEMDITVGTSAVAVAHAYGLLSEGKSDTQTITRSELANALWNTLKLIGEY